MKIFFSVGEPSGDIHGANLIRQLQKQYSGPLELVGYGGPEMAAAGAKLHEDLTRLAVMWILRVLLNLHKFWALLWQADRYFREERPDAVVLIDYPGFNWWIAGRAKKHGIPVFYYGTPQVWAWASWRVKKMRRLVDHALCKLPFEEAWYRARGCRATFVGHPYFDEVRRYELDESFLAQHQSDRPLVAILPGSRTQEVESNLPMMLESARRLSNRRPAVRFAVAAYKNRHAVLAREILVRETADSDLPVDIFVKRTPELIHQAVCCLAVSGSISLELLYHAKPTVIVYRISRLAYAAQFLLRRVKYISLVNLLSAQHIFRSWSRRDSEPGEVIYPEYLTCRDRSPEIADQLLTWIENDAARGECIERLETLRDRLGSCGASQRGATYILRALSRKSRKAHSQKSLRKAA